MENQKGVRQEENSIDLLLILKALLHRAWIIVLVSVICAAIGFSYATFMLVPQYSASVMLYVNSSTKISNVDISSISTSTLAASQHLVNTYVVIMNTRTTLEKVLDDTGLDLSYRQLSGMISTSQVEDTAVFRVTVTSGDPNLSVRAANGIATVLPDRVAQVIDGTSMRIVDPAREARTISPDVKRYTMLGLMLGLAVTCGVIALVTIFDDTIKGEEDLTRNFDIPVLAKVPDLLHDSDRKYQYQYEKPKQEAENEDG